MAAFRPPFIASPYGSISRAEARAILSGEQNHRCCYCGVAMLWQANGHPDNATIEHIHPLCRGGTDDWDNLAGACARCNSGRDDNLHALVHFYAVVNGVTLIKPKGGGGIGGMWARVVRHQTEAEREEAVRRHAELVAHTKAAQELQEAAARMRDAHRAVEAARLVAEKKARQRQTAREKRIAEQQRKSAARRERKDAAARLAASYILTGESERRRRDRAGYDAEAMGLVPSGIATLADAWPHRVSPC